MLLVDQLLQGRLLLRAALKDQNHATQWSRVGQSALVELGSGERVGIAMQGGYVRVVDRLKHPGVRRGKPGLRRRRSRSQRAARGLVFPGPVLPLVRDRRAVLVGVGDAEN